MISTRTIILLVFATNINASFKLGIENIGQQLEHLKNKKIALLTNQTGIDQQKNRTIDLLKEKGFNLVVLLAPEHGIDGTIPAGKQVLHTRDKKSNLPVLSLYKGNDKAQIIPQNRVDTIDIIFFDLQDSGIRHYTYISTLYKILKFCAKQNKQLIVFDRPNPLGSTMEGPLVDPDQHSFISIAPIPLRHGMTIGELAQYFNKKQLKNPARLQVIKMQNYRRTDGLKKISAPLSPNLRNLSSCHGYSFLGLLAEVKPIFAGGKTDKPFQLIMLPEKQRFSAYYWHQLKKSLKKYGIDALITSLYHPILRQKYKGLELSIKNINKISSFNALLKILEFFKQKKITLHFSKLFDKAAGTNQIIQYIQDNGITKKQLALKINNDLTRFHKKAGNYYIYSPRPRLVKVDL